MPASIDSGNVLITDIIRSVTNIEKTGDAEYDAMQIKAFVTLYMLVVLQSQ